MTLGVLKPQDRASHRWYVLPGGPRIVPNAALAFHFRVKVTENCTIEPPVNGSPGQMVVLRIEQPASPVTVALHSSWSQRGTVVMPSSGVGYVFGFYDDVAKAWEASGVPDLSSVYDAAGTAAAAISTHEAAVNPHPTYLTEAEGNALYAPLGSTPLLVQAAQQGVDVNQSNTDVTTFTGLPSKYAVTRFWSIANTGVATSATVALRTASGGGGDAVVANVALASLSSSDAIQQHTVAIQSQLTGATLYVRVTTPAGVAAAVDFLLEVMDLS